MTLEEDLDELRVIGVQNRRLLETMDEGVVLIDEVGQIIQANPAQNAFWG